MNRLVQFLAVWIIVAFSGSGLNHVKKSNDYPNYNLIKNKEVTAENNCFKNMGYSAGWLCAGCYYMQLACENSNHKHS